MDGPNWMPPKDAEGHFEASICKGNKNIATKRPVNTRYWPPIFDANQNFGVTHGELIRILSSEWYFLWPHEDFERLF